jgi:signal transduction histidine kinase/phage shock protein PspC (stress-responsive transcriptional regulator)
MSAVDQGKAYRAVDGRMVAGVAQGLATHLGISVVVVRALFVAATVLGSGAGLLAYLAFWALLPIDPEGEGPAVPDESRGRWIAWTLVAGLLGILTLSALGLASLSAYLVPVAIAVAGIALVWSQADDEQRATWRHGAAGVAREAAGEAVTHGRWRTAVGALAVALAVVGFAVTRVGATTMLQGLATTVLLVIGMLLVAYPWLHSRWDARAEERAARIRADERAELAARIHDSVMQTLTLVQKHADDPQRVQQLARAEEHALREWLYGNASNTSSFVGAMQHAANDVESKHGVNIELVNVGDAAVDSRIEGLLAAAQEAMVNAARHSGANVVQVFTEAGETGIDVFVRDRGQGFDPAAVAADRAGLRESIEGRMQRCGGTATIRTTLGEGTEVRLNLPVATP